MRPWRTAIAVVVAVGSLVACGGDDDSGSSDLSGYVALGDSFSAGVGAPPYDESSGRCDRAERSWPHVLDEQDEGIELLELRACGGARVEHLLSPWTNREQPAQIPSEARDDVGLLTVTIGGNDVGFGDIVAQCVLGDCSELPDGEEFRAALAELTDTLVDDLYPALHAAFPDARIVHVGYPRLTPLTGDLPPECLWLSEAERPAAVAIVDRLNGAIADAAAVSEREVEFVDLADALAGHELCTEDSWVNAISLDAERAHPTADGYTAMAQAVAAALADSD